MEIQVFNLNMAEIENLLGRFGNLTITEEKKFMTYTKFLQFLNVEELKFDELYEKTQFKYSKSQVGHVMLMPNTKLNENTKVVILSRDNVSIGLKNHEGLIFITNSSFNVKINLGPIYKNIDNTILLFEIAKIVRPKNNTFLMLNEFPSNFLVKRIDFEVMIGKKLEIIKEDSKGKKYFDVGQEPIYLAENYFNYGLENEVICRPKETIYLTKMDVGIKFNKDQCIS